MDGVVCCVKDGETAGGAYGGGPGRVTPVVVSLGAPRLRSRSPAPQAGPGALVPGWRPPGGLSRPIGGRGEAARWSEGPGAPVGATGGVGGLAGAGEREVQGKGAREAGGARWVGSWPVGGQSQCAIIPRHPATCRGGSGGRGLSMEGAVGGAPGLAGVPGGARRRDRGGRRFRSGGLGGAFDGGSRGRGLSTGGPVGGAPGLAGVGWRSRQGRDGDIYNRGGRSARRQTTSPHNPLSTWKYISVSTRRLDRSATPLGGSPLARGGGIGGTSGGDAPEHPGSHIT